MNRSLFKNEPFLYFCAFSLAVILRFSGLGALPLNDTEAGWALQALHLSQGTRPLLGSQIVYIAPTGLLFYLFGASNFLARMLPALTGSLITTLPWLFRARLKPIPGLLLAFFLALDPGLIALSRQAGSLMPALVFTLLAWAFWWRGDPRPAGVLAGLAFLSGPALWAGLIGIGLAWGFHRASESRLFIAMNGKQTEAALSSTKPGLTKTGLYSQDLRRALLYCGMTILLGGTLFFVAPNGLSAWVTSIADYLRGWGQPSGIPAGRILLALMVYQPLAVILGGAAILRGLWQGRLRYKRLGYWFVFAILLALLYPGRQVGDIGWALAPLWTLTALELSIHLKSPSGERREVIGMALLVTLFLVFSWLNFTSIALDPSNPANITSNGLQFGGTVFIENLPPTRYLLLISILLLLLVSIILVALGWSARIARMGFLWGLAASLGLYSLAMAWSATGLRFADGWELWQNAPRPAQAALLLASIDDLSEWSTGDKYAQDIVITDLDSPALSWLLRDRTVRIVTTIDAEQSPAIVLTAEQDALNLPTGYRGQDFVWRQSPFWSILSLNDWIRWSVFRKLPYDSEKIVLWARVDIFPDARPSLP